MKIRHILASTLLAGFAALGLAAGLKGARVERASATISEANYAFASSTTEWGTKQVVMQYDDTRPGNVAQLLSRSLAFGEEFKIKTKADWSASYGFAKLVRSEESQYFQQGEGDNIKCMFAGDYDIFLEKDTFNIYLSYVGSATTARIYVQLQTWENTFVYAFDETTDPGNKVEPFGSFPGLKMSLAYSGIGVIDQHGNHLGGLGYVDVPYGNLANTKVIISNGYSGDGNQSGNQDLANGYYYYHTGNTPSQDLGKVSHLIAGVYEYIKDNQSLCDLTRGQAQTLLDEYNGETFYEATCQNAFKKCTFNTWANKDKEGKANFTGEQVVNQLVWLASTQNPNVLLNNNMKNETATSMIIIVAAITLVAIAAGSVLILHRRKEN